jgi:hypothetical protein
MVKEMITEKEKEEILEVLRKEGLEEFDFILKSADPVAMLNRLVETKRAIMNVIEKFGGNRVAFEKADNARTYIYISPDNIPELKEPLELSFEEFVSKFKPILVWHKNGRGTYSSPLGKYSFFAKNYRVILFKVSPIDNNTIKIATKLSKNIYVVSSYLNELNPKTFVLFVP